MERANVIASNVKLIQVNQLISSWSVIFAQLEKQSDPAFIMDKSMHENIIIPQYITPWCVRIVIDKMKLFLNRISIMEIKERLQRDFEVFILTR